MIRAEDKQVPKASRSSASSFKLRYASEVTVRAPEFHLLPSLQFLDVEALSRVAKTKLDIGFFKSPCCERHVHAVIERGIVVSLDVPPCSKPTRLEPDQAAFVTAALKRARRGGSGKFKPAPVKEFLTVIAQQGPPETNCITFTIFGHDIFCCRTGEGPISCIFVEPISVNRL
jgi:hypothetical protein